MTRSVLLLSPHLDDVAFSCGGTAHRLAALGWRVVLATAFTRSVPDPRGFALACQLDKGVGPDVDYMALRRAEDARAAARLGAEPLWLDLPEAPHRGYASAPALFGAFAPEDGIAGELRAVLAPLLAEHDLILAPQTIGNHVDHRRVRDAVLALSPAAPILWYRDTPYVLRHPDARPRPPLTPPPQTLPRSAGEGAKAPSLMHPPSPEAGEGRGGGSSSPSPTSTLTETAVPLLAPSLAAKLDACAAYASQLGFQFGGEPAMRESLTRFARDEAARLGRPGGLAEALLAPSGAATLLDG